MKQKMKPAKTEFIKRDVFYGDLKIWEKWELEFINQDNTDREAQKLENILKNFEWRRDSANVFAAITLTTLIFFFLFVNFHVWYQNNLWMLFCPDPKLGALANFSFFSSFVEPYFFLFRHLMQFNFWLVQILTEINTSFKLFF